MPAPSLCIVVPWIQRLLGPGQAGCCCSHGSAGPMCLMGQRHSGKTHQAAYDDQDGGSLSFKDSGTMAFPPAAATFPFTLPASFPPGRMTGLAGA